MIACTYLTLPFGASIICKTIQPHKGISAHRTIASFAESISPPIILGFATTTLHPNTSSSLVLNITRRTRKAVCQLFRFFDVHFVHYRTAPTGYKHKKIKLFTASHRSVNSQVSMKLDLRKMPRFHSKKEGWTLLNRVSICLASSETGLGCL